MRLQIDDRFTVFALFLFTGVFCAITPVNAGQWKKAAALYSENDAAKCVMVQVTGQSTGSIVLNYTVPAPQVSPVTHQRFGSGPVMRCRLGNAKPYSVPGKPVVPCIHSRVIIPAGRTVSGVRMVPGTVRTLPERYSLSYGEIETPFSRPGPIRAVRDMGVYNSDLPYPGESAELMSIGYRCGVTIAEINIFPLAYRPRSGTITYASDFSLEISLKPANSGTDLPAYPKRLLEGIVTEENTEALSTYPSAKAASGDNCTWLAITSSDIMNATTTPSINDLVDLRASQGHTCKVVSVEDVLASSQGSTDLDKVRNYIKSAYTNWETKYVLLGGDVDIIPIWYEYNTVLPDYETSTDIPYQCLDQDDWEEDFEAEVYIGRISAEDETEFSNQVYKIIKYETDPDTSSYLTHGLSFGETISAGHYCLPAMNDVADKFTDPFTFDQYGDSPTFTTYVDSTLKLLNSDRYAIWNHLAHGGDKYLMGFFNNDERKFTNTNPIFFYSQACDAGMLEKDCITERFTNETRTGFYAGVANSRYGMGSSDPAVGSSQDVHKSFWEGCFSENLNCLGEFNEYSHRSNTQHPQIVLETNLFGDPAIKFRGKESPSYIRVLTPNGGEELVQNHTCDITWEYAQVSGEVKIELINGDSGAEIIIGSTPCTSGSYSWTISDAITQGTQYKIRISTTTIPPILDVSDSCFSISTATEVIAQKEGLPSRFDLIAGKRSINFQVPSIENTPQVSLILYTLQGKAVRRIAEGKYAPGNYRVDLEAGAGKRIANGIYLCTMRAKGFTKTVRVLVGE